MIEVPTPVWYPIYLPYWTDTPAIATAPADTKLVEAAVANHPRTLEERVLAALAEEYPRAPSNTEVHQQHQQQPQQATTAPPTQVQQQRPAVHASKKAMPWRGLRCCPLLLLLGGVMLGDFGNSFKPGNMLPQVRGEPEKPWGLAPQWHSSLVATTAASGTAPWGQGEVQEASSQGRQEEGVRQGGLQTPSAEFWLVAEAQARRCPGGSWGVSAGIGADPATVPPGTTELATTTTTSRAQVGGSMPKTTTRAKAGKGNAGSTSLLDQLESMSDHDLMQLAIDDPVKYEELHDLLIGAVSRR